MDRRTDEERVVEAVDWCEGHFATIVFGQQSVKVKARKYYPRTVEGKDIIDAVIKLRHAILSVQDS